MRFIILFLFVFHSAFGFLSSVSNIVTVGADIPGWIAHSVEAGQLAEQINQQVENIRKVTQVVNQTKKVYSVLADPSSVIDSISSVDGLLREMHNIYGNEDTRALLNLNRSLKSLRREQTSFKQAADWSNGKYKRNVTLSDFVNTLVDLEEVAQDQIEKEYKKKIKKEQKYREEQLEKLKALENPTIHNLTEYDAMIQASFMREKNYREIIKNLEKTIEENNSEIDKINDEIDAQDDANRQNNFDESVENTENRDAELLKLRREEERRRRDNFNRSSSNKMYDAFKINVM